MENSVSKQLSQLGADETRALLETICTHSFDSILITDADPVEHRIVYANPAFCQMTGYTMDELIGQSPRILAGPQTNRAVTERLKAALQAGGPFKGAATNYRKDGTTYPVQWNIHPLHDANGQPRWFVSVQKNLSELRHTLNQLKSSSHQFKHFLDTLVNTKRPDSKTNVDTETAKEVMRENAQVLARYVNTSVNASAGTNVETNDDFDDDDFFDFDDVATDTHAEDESQPKISAEQFLQNTTIEKNVLEDIHSICNSFTKLVDSYEPIDLSLDERRELIEELQELANAVFYVEEFMDISVSLSELSVAMYHNIESRIDLMTSEALKGLTSDLSNWVNDVFLTQSATDIHWLDNSIIGSCKQILVFCRLRQSQDDDEDEIF